MSRIRLLSATASVLDAATLEPRPGRPARSGTCERWILMRGTFPHPAIGHEKALLCRGVGVFLTTDGAYRDRTGDLRLAESAGELVPVRPGHGRARLTVGGSTQVKDAVSDQQDIDAALDLVGLRSLMALSSGSAGFRIRRAGRPRRRATSAIGVKPCGGCAERAARLNGCVCGVRARLELPRTEGGR